MPITLEKLFSPTAKVEFEFLDEIIHVTFAPFRYTGEMQDMADKMTAETDTVRDELVALRAQAADATKRADALDESPERDEAQVLAIRAMANETYAEIEKREAKLTVKERSLIRRFLSELLVTWDVLMPDGKPHPTDEASLKKLPDAFLLVVFLKLVGENQPDPTNAPGSDDSSTTEKSSARSRPGTNTSRPPAPSGSRHSSSTKGRTARAGTRSGGGGR